MVKDNYLLGKFNLHLGPAPHGDPKIEVTFDVDANSIQDAEKFHAEDEIQKEQLSAKNSLESFCININSTCNDAIAWLNNNQHREKGEYEQKLTETAQICLNFINSTYQVIFICGFVAHGTISK